MAILTIVIPTRNREKMVIRLVERLLSKSNDDIRIVIYNNSDSNTLDGFLSDSKDYRLQCLNHDYNVGAYRNLLMVMKPTDSIYNLLIIDRDIFLEDCLEKLISTLKDVDKFSVGYLEQRNIINFNDIFIKVYDDNYQAACHSILHGKHPSGWIFSNEYLKSNYNVFEDLINSEEVFLYPHELFLIKSKNITPFVRFIVSKDCGFGNASNYNVTKSGFDLSNQGTIPWCDQDIVYKDLSNRLIHLKDFDVKKPKKYQLYWGLVSSGLIRVTLDKLNAFNPNNPFASHYNVEPKYFSKFELIQASNVFANLLLNESKGDRVIFFLIKLANINNYLNILIPVMRFVPRSPFKIIKRLIYGAKGL
jgi:hypothetical protein